MQLIRDSSTIVKNIGDGCVGMILKSVAQFFSFGTKRNLSLFEMLKKDNCENKNWVIFTTNVILILLSSVLLYASVYFGYLVCESPLMTNAFLMIAYLLTYKLEIQKFKKLYSIFNIAIYNVVTYSLVQWALGWFIAFGYEKCIVLNFLCSLILLLFFLIITGSVKLSCIASQTAWLLLATVDWYVLRFRGYELTPSDFFSVNTAMNVIDNYKFAIDINIILAWVFFVFFNFFFKKVELCSFSWLRTKAVCLLLATSFLCVHMTADIAPLYYMDRGGKFDGYILNFCLGFKYLKVDAPEEYSEENVDALAAEYAADLSADDDAPNIIVIMNESFSDFNIYDNFKTDTEVTPFLNSLKENTVKGYALSSVFGGSTPNSEYEFLTGNSCGMLPTYSIPYQQFVKHDTYSIVSSLKQRNYECVSMHPFEGSGWNRPAVYNYLGFDKSYFQEDFPQEDIIRKYVSDREMYRFLIDRFENRDKNKKIFMYGITMQNHGGYRYEGENFEPTVTPSGYSKKYDDAEQYLTLVRESDAAIKELVTYLQSVDDKVVLLFYGDHQPLLDDGFYAEMMGKDLQSLTLEEQQLQYTVPFYIWANYDIEEKEVEQKIGLNYLSNYLYEAAGMDLPAYNKFLTDAEKIIPSMNSKGYFSEKNHCYIPYKEAQGEEKELLDNYKILTYNSLFDPEHLNQKLFPLKK